MLYRLLMPCFMSLFMASSALQSASVAATTSYPEFCRLAVENDIIFTNFKRHPCYCLILEHVSYELGKQYLEIIHQDYPELLAYSECFRENDKIGNPVTFNYEGIGDFSPTTLRYIKVAGDLKRHFGDLSQLHIVEIGGGYGGQCKVLAACGGFASYTIIDLAPASALAQKYLHQQGVTNVTCLDNEHLPAGKHYDLVISNFAFSEIDRLEQYKYLEQVIKPIPYGYMTYNFISPMFRVSSMPLEEFLGFLTQNKHAASVKPEKPLSGPASNRLIIWEPITTSVTPKKTTKKARFKRDDLL